MKLMHFDELSLGHNRIYSDFPVGHSYGKRVTECYEFDYILFSDQGKMITNGESVDLVPGMFFVRTPGTHVEGIFRYASWYMRFQPHDEFPIPTGCYHLPVQQCHPVFRQIYDLHIRQPLEYQYQMDYHMNTLIFWLFQELNRLKEEVLKDHPLDELYKQMQYNWDKNYPLEYYVKLSGYSKSYFCHLFQKTYKISPIQFLHEKRLQNLCYQLIETDRPVKELMIANGYKNEQSFFRTFKTYTGETPLSYRQKHRFRK